ncbi:relaxase/mobilization nuclease domain-containing protein [Sphingobacterium hotanense]|uniref:relaxase/mobilization nuclease domain-containing protein n=1 Tax=Sphingobacterium hotanense TaxID=649196 RepID=UPI0021A94906|nr:relaxase/mobilization nuclease domain-containing protein [Sphingobacterium hotanense]MCT1523866.1 relaxase/mobilization nuclease domain-containing protein [Sphingobacterium hotanense]
MVAVIKTGHSIHRIFNYNENKVKEGVAECIGAGNYLVDVEKMSGTMKLNRLLKQAALNENVTRNSVHVSLNFDASDTGLTKEKLMEIADTYMRKIGFGDQPYLVYQHFDAGHPHIHLVSVKVRADGSRIDTQNIGRNQSEKARREIEKSFGLVVADDRKKQEAFRLQLVDVRKVQYGRTDTRRAITNVLQAVLDKYRYTSLPELNAVLRQYNVLADRGGENSRVFKSGGLVYRVLDEQGNPIGVPIKASDIYSKPTLKFLETKFKGNEARRMLHRARVKNAVDMALLHKKTLPIEELVQALKKQGIDTILRKNEDGLLYGITYVDHRTGCVFNGSALGKAYSAKAIQERCSGKAVSAQELLQHPALKPGIELQSRPIVGTETKDAANDLHPAPLPSGTGNMLDVLMQPEQASDYVAGQLKRKRKKKKRKNLSNNQ